LAQNYPNPFNPTTTIVFTVPSAVNHYSLKIYDIKGSLVRTIGEGQLAAGRYEVIWDGLTDYGSRAASGIYIYRMVADRFSDTKKMVLIK
jgi:flagellar hook assembly protein FlgD